jgi:hypothetical protein
VGGIFSSPKPPKPDPAIAAAQAAQEARLAKQEKRAEQREASEERKIAASRNARRTGGIRMLLAQREDAQAGIEGGLQTTLGNSLT